MKSMGSVNSLSLERYECPSCDKEFKREEVHHTWECPDCNELILVYAEDKDSNTKIILERKRAYDITTLDLIYINGMLTGKSYQILGINEFPNNQLGFGLKGYGQWKVSEDEIINCCMGSW